MEDKGAGTPRVPGTGRGSMLLEMMRRKKQEESEQAARESERASVQPPGPEPSSAGSSTSLGRGRALLLEMQKMKSEGAPPRHEEPPPGVGRVLQAHPSPETRPAQGRANPLGLLKRISTPGPAMSSEPQSSRGPSVSADSGGVLGQLAELSVAESKSASASEPVSRQGTTGTRVSMSANYINLKIAPGKGLFQYEVQYKPDIDSRPLRQHLLNQHVAKFGKTKTFDGSILYLPRKLDENRVVLQSEHPSDGTTVTLTLIYKKQQAIGDNIQFFNVLLGRLMRALSLVRIGRQNFNPKCAHPVPKHRLEVWPGYVTAINEYEGGLKLCIDAKHRVMRTDTVRDLMYEIYQRRKADYRQAVVMEIVGASVLTRYNNKTYRIDDIAWDKDPTFVFDKKNAKTSLIDYYKSHWNLEIKDKGQPLLVHRAKQRLPTGETQENLILLIPELCYIAGLTDGIRSDFRIMKDLDAVTKVGPTERREVIRRFIQQVRKTPVTNDILAEWGLEMEDDTICFTGRTLPPEVILFGNEVTVKPKNIADWGSATVNNPVLRTASLQNWYILYCQRDSRCASDFLEMLQKVSGHMGMRISKPMVVALRDDRTDSYVRELRAKIERNVDLVVIVFPSNRTDRYSAVKRLCCVDMPIPSQVIIARTISQPQKLKSVTQKIALQINCKLGGALWALKMPYENCMICGIDVYHPGLGQSSRGSVAGFVASLDKLLTSWFSKICLQSKHQELVDLLQVCLLSAIKAFQKRNGRNPDRIIIYRDGVGDGQIDTVKNYEVKQLLATFANIDPGYTPQLSVVIVQKRINTRLFTRTSTGDLGNPEPGTVVDSEVTRRNYYDFFLVSQNVRQGTVSPTHYIVAHDGANMKPDHMQRLTYKLCHLYYNWPGTVRVPAPCQYAHKLVYLVGQSIGMEPHVSLSDTLFYL